MTKERLEEYRSMKEEISELKERVSLLKNDDSVIKADTILDYRTGQGIPKRIEGIDQRAYWHKRKHYLNRIQELRKACDEVEEWVEGIEDSMTRRIFRMVYMDGMSQTEVGTILHLDRSRISRRITDFIKKCGEK